MYRILWISQFALHDTTSGAALQCRTMLEYLAKIYGQKLQIHVLTCLLFDDPRGTKYFNDNKDKMKANEVFVQFEENGIQYTYVKNHTTVSLEQNFNDQRKFYTTYQHAVAHFRPDLIIGYGGDPMCMHIRNDAHARGVPNVFCVCNGTYKGTTFLYCDRVITDSMATAAFYGKNFGINVIPVGEFIRPETVVVPKKDRKPQYVTFINPSHNKGLSVFARIALMAQEQLPEVKFMVVESRGSFAKNLELLYEPGPDGKPGAHPFKAEMFKNVELHQHTDNIKEVYALTKVILIPSLWFECWGRVATEAVMNDIPVISSKSGGLPEAGGEKEGASACLDVPERCINNYLLIPSAEEVQPWIDKLRSVLGEDYQKYTKGCAQAAKRHDPRVTAERVFEVIEPLLRRKAGDSAQLIRSGAYDPTYMNK